MREQAADLFADGRQSGVPAGREEIHERESASGLGCGYASEMPNVTVQLLPLSSTAHPGLLSGFSLAGFAPPLPEVVVLENLSGAAYVEGEDTAPYAQAFQHVQATALSVEDSLVLAV